MSALEDLARNMVLEYLALMNKDYYLDGDDIVVREKIDGEEKKVIISIRRGWIVTWAPVYSLEELDGERLFRVYEKLLELNTATYEIKFGVKNKNILVSVESNITSLTYDNFSMEYGAIPYALKMAKREILPLILGKEMESEKEEEG